jgi:hypothetical protein
MEHLPPTASAETPETETGHERLPETMEGVFNFDKLAPEEAAVLIELFSEFEGTLRRREGAVPGFGTKRGFTRGIEADLAAYCIENPERGEEFFDVFRQNADSLAVRAAAAASIAPHLVRHYEGDYVKRQPIIDGWVSMLRDDDEIVRETANEAMSDAIEAGWFDEPTARYLNAMLTEGWQRHDWL